MAAYVIAEVQVDDPETYAKYAVGVPPTLQRYGGRYHVRGGTVEPVEGNWQPQRAVILEFPDMASAKAWYYSPEYQSILKIRQAASRAKLIFVEGVVS